MSIPKIGRGFPLPGLFEYVWLHFIIGQLNIVQGANLSELGIGIPPKIEAYRISKNR